MFGLGKVKNDEGHQGWIDILCALAGCRGSGWLRDFAQKSGLKSWRPLPHSHHNAWRYAFSYPNPDGFSDPNHHSESYPNANPGSRHEFGFCL